jgi:hypothetical protein
MPWKEILGGVSGGVAAAVVVTLLVLKLVIEKVVEAAQKRFEHALKRAEEVHKVSLAMASTIDTDLRQRRIAPYSELWKATGALPQWPRNRELTYQDLQSLTNLLRKWYFESGGMYLSTSARTAYGEVQKALTSVLEKPSDGQVTDSDYESIRGKCHELRIELTQDLLSRREPPVI